MELKDFSQAPPFPVFCCFSLWCCMYVLRKCDYLCDLEEDGKKENTQAKPALRMLTGFHWRPVCAKNQSGDKKSRIDFLQGLLVQSAGFTSEKLTLNTFIMAGSTGPGVWFLWNCGTYEICRYPPYVFESHCVTCDPQLRLSLSHLGKAP